MEKRGKPPYFEKMYPEASREVIACLKKSQRKMQHMEYDIKVPRTYVSRRTGKTVTLPPLEVSMEFYLDAGFDFPDERVDIENDFINKSAGLFIGRGSLSDCAAVFQGKKRTGFGKGTARVSECGSQAEKADFAGFEKSAEWRGG